MSARAAAAKMNARAKVGSRGVAVLSRQCACGQHSIGGATCEACQSKQRAGSHGARHAAARVEHKGTTFCKPSGELDYKVYEEHAVGKCVELHEQTHVKDPIQIEGCRRFRECERRGDNGVPVEIRDPTLKEDQVQGQCAFEYNRWNDEDGPTRADTELKAYTAEAACLSDTIDAHCGAGSTRAGIIGASVLGAGGIAGGIAGGVAGGAALAPKVSATPKTGGIVGGIAGGILGGVIGAVGGWFLGKGIQRLFAGPQASETDCAKVKLEPDKVAKAIEEYQKTANVRPYPFQPDGQILRSLIPGIVKPRGAPRADSTPKEPGQPTDKAVSIQTRKAIGLRRDAHYAGRRRYGDLTGIPTLAAARPSVGNTGLGAHSNFPNIAARHAELEAPPAPAIVQKVLQSGGAPLDQATRVDMEQRFASDFTAVRVHSDASAAAAAHAVDASAFTVGRHIVFGSGGYDSGSRQSRALIAHELTHVLQQGSADVSTAEPIDVAPPDGWAEREARDNAARISHGGESITTNVTSLRLARAPANTGDGTGKRRLPRWASAAIFAGTGVGITGLALAIAGTATKVSGGTIACLLGAAAGVGAIFGEWDPFGWFEGKTDDTAAKHDDEPAQPKLTFEQALKEGAAKLRPKFGVSPNQGGGGYDASEWEGYQGEDTDPPGETILKLKKNVSPWVALDHMFKNIDKEVPSSTGGKTKWSFDCFEYVHILHLYAIWRSMERSEFEKAFPTLEIGFHSARMYGEWQETFKADRPGQAPYQFIKGETIDVPGHISIAPLSNVPIKKTWQQLLDEAPVGSQIIWSNIDAQKRCSKDKTLPFSSFQNENATKLGKDSYSAHPFGVKTEDYIRTAMATVVLEYDATLTPKYKKLSREEEKKDYVDEYVKTHLGTYMAKNVYISAIRYARNPARAAPASATGSTSPGP
jgi:Domain of unknown function (DUF4157)